MLKSIFYKKYLFLGIVLFLMGTLPSLLIESIRHKLLAFTSPVIKLGSRKGGGQDKEAIAYLEGENHLLKLEIGKLCAFLEQQNNVKRSTNDLLIFQLSAQVIYRDPVSWTSSVWINVGEEDNRRLGRKVVGKNSPVIIGKSIVGAVDFVGNKQSRVRLITDMALRPSVRALRGYGQNVALAEGIDSLLHHLNRRSSLPLSDEERTCLLPLLEKLRGGCLEKKEEWYLAKGTLQGGGDPLWRSLHHTLRGIGFNYDFADEKGPSRELATGKPIDSVFELPVVPLLQVSDLLVTTGMDGVFPPGLRVAEVTKVFPLKEGAYTYEIEARPFVGNLDTLQTVFVIPPLGYDPEDQPSQWH